MAGTISKLLYSPTMSLDGFIAGPRGDLSWLTEHPAEDVGVAEHSADIGALLVGKRTYAGALGGTWQGPRIVLTHEPVPAADPNVMFVDQLDRAVVAAKKAAAGKYVTVLGANVARQCLEARLLDELLVLIAPVLLGDGTRLFDYPGGTRVRLEPLHKRDSSTTRFWFRIAR